MLETFAEKIQSGLTRSNLDRGHLYVAESARNFNGIFKNMRWDKSVGALIAVTSGRAKHPTAMYTSPVLRCRFPATEFLPSWNILLGKPEQGFRVYLRVGNRTDEKKSPWFFLGEGGRSEKIPVKTDSPAWGRTRMDYLHLKKTADLFQFRVEFFTAKPSGSLDGIELKRFFLHYSGKRRKGVDSEPVAASRRKIRIPVPYRSQLDVETEKLRHIVCCPTCVSMVLEHYGIDVPTEKICVTAYDDRHDTYGIWPRAGQAAFQHGCRAWIQRFRNVDDVRRCLESGQPIIASIRVGDGELRGARYPNTTGHLIVIVGYSGKGNMLVNDPYSAGPDGATIVYKTEDIEKVWLDKGGVGIIIERPVNSETQT